MEPLFMGLIAMGASWLFVGYLCCRIINALNGPTDAWWQWDWNRPVENDDGRAWFTAGTLLGWITAILFIVIFLCLVLILGTPWLFKEIGYLIAPGEPHKKSDKESDKSPQF